MERKTKLQIIEETVQFYTENPTQRADRKGEDGRYRCEYITPDGRKCALGRYMIDPSLFSGKNSGTVTNLVNRTKEFLLKGEIILTQEHLVPEVRGHEWSFWSELQAFHDDRGYWGPAGITPVGNNYIAYLKRKYGTDSEG